jgi:hypothetical protein
MQYGSKRDYPKIDLYVRDASGKGWKYVVSTTWAKTCAIAVDAYQPMLNGVPVFEVRARRASKA